MNAHRHIATTIAAAALFLTAACSGDDSSGDGSTGSSDGLTVNISGQASPEGELIASMYEQVLDAEGYDASVELVDTREDYLPEGQLADDVQVMPEYVGGLVAHLAQAADGPDAESLASKRPKKSLKAAEDLLADAGVSALKPSKASSDIAFFVSQAYQDEHRVSELSDVDGKEVVLAGPADCEGSPTCEAGLSDVYGIDVTEVLPLGFSTEETFESVLNDEAQMGLTSVTDGTLAIRGLVVLEDDRNMQPAQNLVPAVSSAWIAEHQDAEEALNKLMGALSTDILIDLNARVSLDKEDPAVVAEDFLTIEGLI